MYQKKLKDKLRIAIFSADDVVWGLTNWERSIPMLVKEHDVVGIYLFPDRLAKLKNNKIVFWYLKVFGIWVFIILGLFALKQRYTVLTSTIRSWQQLAQAYRLQLHHSSSPNSKEVLNWLSVNNIDIIIITVGDIISQSIINKANIGIINKHAAMLPSCRGLYPFFWARLFGFPTGITFHIVDSGIDTGRIILQVDYPSKDIKMSMLRFYIDVFSMFPKMVSLAIHRLAQGQYVDALPELKPSYYSLPTRKDYREFYKKGFRICRISDLFYSHQNEV